jgi:hypothetical protein
MVDREHINQGAMVNVESNQRGGHSYDSGVVSLRRGFVSCFCLDGREFSELIH